MPDSYDPSIVPVRATGGNGKIEKSADFPCQGVYTHRRTS